MEIMFLFCSYKVKGARELMARFPGRPDRFFAAPNAAGLFGVIDPNDCDRTVWTFVSFRWRDLCLLFGSAVSGAIQRSPAWMGSSGGEFFAPARPAAAERAGARCARGRGSRLASDQKSSRAKSAKLSIRATLVRISPETPSVSSLRLVPAKMLAQAQTPVELIKQSGTKTTSEA